MSTGPSTSIPTSGYSEVYNPNNYRLESSVDGEAIGRDYIDEAPPSKQQTGSLPSSGGKGRIGGVGNAVASASLGGAIVDGSSGRIISHGRDMKAPYTPGQ